MPAATDMSDAELLTAFERSDFPPGTFTHREHVRVTWLHLRRYGRAEAERRLLLGLQALAARAGTPGKFSARLTRAWLDRIEASHAASPAAASFDEFAAANPHLLDARAVLET
jgi:hypothetical protein